MANDIRTRFTFRLPKDLFSKLDEKANNIGVSKNALLIQILWSYLEEQDKKGEQK